MEDREHSKYRLEKFTIADVDAMRQLLALDCTVQQVAERFDTSRYTVSR